jgi:carbon-monoxide dehydrogenase medium subunit
VSPSSIDEVIRLLDRQDAKILSGGQSLMPMLAFRIASCGLLIDLRHVPGLERITIDESGVELGARVTWRDLERGPRLRHAHPLLQAAIPHIDRIRGVLSENLCRCTGYIPIVEAVMQARAAYARPETPA